MKTGKTEHLIFRASTADSGELHTCSTLEGPLSARFLIISSKSRSFKVGHATFPSGFVPRVGSANVELVDDVDR